VVKRLVAALSDHVGLGLSHLPPKVLVEFLADRADVFGSVDQVSVLLDYLSKHVRVGWSTPSGPTAAPVPSLAHTSLFLVLSPGPLAPWHPF
jgi:hypothetical protein